MPANDLGCEFQQHLETLTRTPRSSFGVLSCEVSLKGDLMQSRIQRPRMGLFVLLQEDVLGSIHVRLA